MTTVLIGKGAGLPDITGRIANTGISEFTNVSVANATGVFKDAETVWGYPILANTNYPQVVMITLKFGASKGETKTDGTLKTENDYHVFGKSNRVDTDSITVKYWKRIA